MSASTPNTEADPAGLPAFYPVLERGGEERVYRQRFERLLEAGHRMLYLRARDLPEPVYWQLAEELARAMPQDGCLMIRADAKLSGAGVSAAILPTLGLHVSCRPLQALRTRPVGWRRVGAACHCLADLKRAEALGLDFAVLSPVLSTPTHPGDPPLGWETARTWIASVNLPVYLMGGLKRSDLIRSRTCGAQGIAGIRLFLD